MQRTPWLLGATAALTLIVTAGPAVAHIQLTCPPARYSYNATGIKTGPCGASGGTKSNAVTHLTAGQSLLVTFTETVYHPGFFRISVDTTGMEKFPAISSTPMNPVMAPVLADNILPHTSGSSNAKRTFMVTIPNTPCTKCQLQLTQFMSDNPNSGYYECADIVIDDAATGTPYVCGGGGTSGGGGASGGGGRMGGGGRQGGSAGATGNGGATGSGSGGASTAGSGGAGGGGPGGATTTGSGGSASGGAMATGSGGSASGGSSSGGATGSGGVMSASGGQASGGTSSGGNGSGGSGSGGNGSMASGSGGAKGPGGNDDGSGGCSYASGAPITDLALALAVASLVSALARRRRARPRA